MITENTDNNSEAAVAAPVSSASYIVYKDGNNINELNGSTGAIYSGTDATTVINKAIKDSYGGSLVIKPAIYSLRSSLIIDNWYYNIQGEYGTILQLANGVNTDVFKMNNAVYGILKGFTIDGNNANNTSGHGININGGWWVKFEDLKILNTAKNGINAQFISGSAGTTTLTINNVTVTRFKGYGMYISNWLGAFLQSCTVEQSSNTGSLDAIFMSGCEFSTLKDCYVEPGSGCILKSALNIIDSSVTVIGGFYWTTNNTSAAININGGRGVTLINPWVSNDGTANALVIDKTSNNTTIMGGEYSTHSLIHTGPVKIIDNGIRSRFINVKGYADK